jgi:hypothetical protein
MMQDQPIDSECAKAVLCYLQEHSEQGFSSNDVFLALASQGLTDRVLDVRVALFQLLDAERIRFNEKRKYQYLIGKES